MALSEHKMMSPVPEPQTIEIRDYNGTGMWSREGILDRYADYARLFHVTVPATLKPLDSTANGVRWIYPIMDPVIDAIEAKDAAAIEIGVEFIEQDQTFPFGKILKSNTARALRRADLNDDHKERIRRRVLQMLLDGMVPREYREYAKLLRKVGIGDNWDEIEKKLDRSNPYVMHYYRYFVTHALKDDQ
jgi:hypothetical protein